jgi:hypothetical protein
LAAVSPAQLRPADKEEYLLLVSRAFVADGDLDRAKRRLAALGEPDFGHALSAQLEKYLRRGMPAEVMGELAALAAAIGVNSPAVALFVAPTSPAGAPSRAAETGTPRPSDTPAPPAPTPGPQATPLPLFRLRARERLCRPAGPAASLQFLILDAAGRPMPGVELVVRWDEGEDRFFTGLQPEIGAGFADFAMSPDVSYEASVAAGSPAVSGLSAVPCSAALGGGTGGWRLTFQRSSQGQP